jgi:inhibitor of KinA sporulation pathway (predicted exonuclease)
MATTINEAKIVTLIDGTELSVRPLKISLLRPFMKKFEQIADVAEDNEKSMDVLLECVTIALKQYNPELAEDPKALEELLDLPTVYEIVEEASGIKLGDVNLLTR